MQHEAGTMYRRAGFPMRVAVALLPVVLFGVFFAAQPVGIAIAHADPTTCELTGPESAGQFIAAGSATSLTPGWRLTDSGSDEFAQVFYGQKVPVTAPGGFVSNFDLQITPGPSAGFPYGADGAAFIIQNGATPTNTGIGNPTDLAGGGLGYNNTNDSLAVVFDTFQNPEKNDPSSNFVSVNSGGTGANDNDSAGTSNLGKADLDSTPVALADGTVHHVRIAYASASLSVFIDDMGTPKLTVPVNIAAKLGLDSSQTAWIGLGSGTGTYTDTHDVTSWQYCADPVPPPVTPAAVVHVASTTPPVSSSLTLGQNAVWTVAVNNTSGTTATNVTATLHAQANGGKPLGFVGSLMAGCVAGAQNAEVCTLSNIPANGTQSLNVFVPTTGLAAHTTVTGTVTISATGATNATGALGAATMAASPPGSVVTAAAPGVEVKTPPPTPTQPTQQILQLPKIANAPAIPVMLQSITPSSKLSAVDKQLCLTTGTKCSGQISVFAGDFSKYNDKSKPVQIKVVAKWGTKVGAGKLLMIKDTGGPPVQLAPCVLKGGKYNTPCAKPEVITGSAAKKNLTTTSTVLFTGADPHLGRRLATGPDAPTAVKATVGKGKATVTWAAPVVTNGRLTGYTITAHLGKAVAKSVNAAGTALKGVVTGLQKGKAYTFTVVAKNQKGLSLASKASNAVKPT